MKLKAIARAAATATCLCWSLLPGCSHLNQHFTGWGQNKSPSSAVQIGKTQNDGLGRPLPGSKVPVQPTFEEARPELSEQTRSHVAMAMGEMLESGGSLGSAQEHYEQALKHDPKSLQATLALARLYARQGRPEAALKLYQNAEKYHRRSAALFNDRGLLLAEQKDWPGAIAALRTCVKLEPSEEKYHNNLGMVLALSGNTDEAWKEFREAVGAAPAHFNVAMILLQNNQRAEARDHLERALALMPNFQKAHDLLVEIDGRAATLGQSATLEPEIQVDLEDSTSTAVANVELPEPSDTQPDPVSPAFHAVPFDPPASAAAEETPDKNPWSKRWVAPRWLR